MRRIKAIFSAGLSHLNMEWVSFLPGVIVGNNDVYCSPIPRDGETGAYKNCAILIDPEFGTACANVKPGGVITGNIGLLLLVWGNF